MFHIINDVEQVKYLYHQGLDFTVNNHWAIVSASMQGSVEIVDFLLEIGLDPSVEDNLAIRMACKEGRFEMVKSLYKSGKVDITVYDNYCITCAAGKGFFNIVKYLNERGAWITDLCFIGGIRSGDLETGKYVVQETGQWVWGLELSIETDNLGLFTFIYNKINISKYTDFIVDMCRREKCSKIKLFLTYKAKQKIVLLFLLNYHSKLIHKDLTKMVCYKMNIFNDL